MTKRKEKLNKKGKKIKFKFIQSCLSSFKESLFNNGQDFLGIQYFIFYSMRKVALAFQFCSTDRERDAKKKTVDLDEGV